MKRRIFSKHILTAAAAASLPLSAYAKVQRRVIYPKTLKKGDIVGFISPGSYLSDEGLEKSIKNVESLGLKVKLSKNIRAKRGYNAGTNAQRLSDLHEMFSDKTVAAIWCIRGGYGCTKIIDNIDYQLIKRNPKLLIGYSDITALLLAIYCKTGLIGFHGPAAVSNFTPYTKAAVEKMLMGNFRQFSIDNAAENAQNDDVLYHPKVIQKGMATGTLIGGNLSLLAALAGTKYAPDYKQKLVFIEDIGEAPYRIDRMLVQLRQSSNLEAAAGIILGIFNGCEAKNLDTSLSLMDTFQDNFGHLKIPIIYGFSFGHIDHQCTFPIGIKASLDTKTMRVTAI